MTNNPLTKEGIYKQLRREIIIGALPPGTHLTEQMLADRFQASRTPIREVLAKLAVEGLVDHKPHRGGRVRSISESEIRNVFDIRILLEGYAARRAAQSMTEETLDRLKRNHEQSLIALERSQADDEETRINAIHRVLELNFDFHAIIARASDNPEVARLIEQLHYLPIIFKSLVVFGADGRRRFNHQHELLMDSFQQRDPAYAEAIMRMHMFQGREACLAGLNA